MKKIKYYKDDEVTMSDVMDEEILDNSSNNTLLCYYNQVVYDLKGDTNPDGIIVVHSDNVCGLSAINELIDNSELIESKTFSYLNFSQTYFIYKCDDVKFITEYTEGSQGIYIRKEYTEGV